MAIQIFDNIEYTSVQAFLLAPSDNLVIWFFDPTDLITQRKLVGYSLVGWWESTPAPPNAIRTPTAWCSCRLTVAQPLNQSVAPAFTNSDPLGGAVTQITNQIRFLGNATGISIIPLDITIFRITLEVSDLNITGFPADLVACDLTLFWDHPKISNR